MTVRPSSQPETPQVPAGRPPLDVVADEARRVVELLDRLEAELGATTRALDAYAERLRDGEA
ncbi:unannotated protein [freshwater metagenome]|uniref:Unannotated protein n=1 Tax=freshwater metagenome TaxID=449393 RepID=A0A6J7J5K3_9ZZZZ|nr:hypothetical protein [Actinomycetota bacterium]